MWWLIAAGLFFLVSAAVCATHVVVIGRLTRKQEDDQLAFHIHGLFGLINSVWEVPIIKVSGTALDIKTETHSHAVADKTKNQRIGVRSVMHRIEQLEQLLRGTDRLFDWIGRVLLRVKLLEWRWQTAVGTGDAMWTAMACGTVWTVQTTLLGVCSQFMQLRTTPRMTVTPVYSHVHFSTEWSCIAKIRFGYAIIAGLQLLVRIRRVKGGFTTWQNILFKG
ncbi:DUF2953 domain-containing protein [Paenibacillus sp. 1P07SE]|uniref:DUF2953 domain-containing protein n=1 Tax=Paenibacillus sp. 1P07SE TaxID=3132209 RepID=UPI0039A6600E